MEESLFLSAHSSTPMYAQIFEQIMGKVLSGDWGPNHPLPSIRELASASNVSVITVKRAYQELEQAGVIVTWHGKGSFVADSFDVSRSLVLEEFNAHLLDLVTRARKLGMTSPEVLRRVEQALSSPSGIPAKSSTQGQEHEAS